LLHTCNTVARALLSSMKQVIFVSARTNKRHRHLLHG
jgi:hypothetical protein